MTDPEIAQLRLHNLLLTAPRFESPADAVRWLGAVQAQDYLGSLWALGLRVPGSTEADIERAIADRQIVRTWPMRGTIHLVAPEDVRWMLWLLTPRVIARQSATFLARFGMDETMFTEARDLVQAALQGGKQLPRGAMYRALEEGGISTSGGRGMQILWRLAQEGLICFAARQGKQPAFALLDEWLPPGKDLARDEALAELALRYFRSHGPATVQDFAWWSGLSLTDARKGLDAVTSQLASVDCNGQTYWFSEDGPIGSESSAYLLPPYDEFTVAYKDRRIVLAREHHSRDPFSVLGPTIALDGRIVGNWRRDLRKDSVQVTAQPFDTLSSAEAQAFAHAAGQYGRFLGLPVEVSA